MCIRDRGGTVAFSFKGEANPSNKTAKVNGTYGPLYLFEQNFKNVPIINELFGKNVEESLLAADFKVKKDGNKTDFIFNPLKKLISTNNSQVLKYYFNSGDFSRGSFGWSAWYCIRYDRDLPGYHVVWRRRSQDHGKRYFESTDDNRFRSCGGDSDDTTARDCEFTV